MQNENVFTERRPSAAGTGASRGGSALVIVIGFLAVLTLLGIAFATFVRTEQAGATSLKNALIAKQALNTAIGRIAESIDLSFGDVSNNWAVGVWPCPWLSSSNEEHQDFFQSAALETGEKPVARIVTKEIADMLTPLQRYLARSAKCSWAPIYGSLEAGTALSKPSKANDAYSGQATQFGRYGVEGYNSSDSVVGRYAFIALETTGLLDANCSGGGRSSEGKLGSDRRPLAGRLASRGEDPAFFLLPDNNSVKGGDSVLKDCLATDPDGYRIPLALENAGTFLSARKTAQGKKSTGGAFSSFGEIRSAAGSSFDLDLPDKPAKKNAAGHAYFPADLFSMFAPSLEDLDPDGIPKVPLPGEGEIAKLPGFAPRAMLAMAKVFANASYDEESTAGNSTDYYTIFPKKNSYRLSRARLATVAMIDAMDPDVVPGKSFANANGTGSELYAAWESLPDIESVKASVVSATGDSGTTTVSDKLTVSAENRRGDNGPLNFPCTESVPQLNRVYVYMTVDPPSSGDWHEGLGSNSYVRVRGKFHVGAVAGLRNLAKADNARKDSYKIQVDCAMLLSTPRDSVASVAGAPIKCNLLEQLVGVPDSDDEYAFQGLKRTWSVDDLELEIGGDDVVEVSVDEGSGSVEDANTGNKMFSAEREVPFVAKLYASAYPDTGDPDDEYNQGTGQIVGDPDIVGGIHHGDYTYFPLTDAEGGSDDLYIPFRFRVTIKHEKSGKIVQQVPAPMLDDRNGTYWIRADAAVYHHPDSSFEGEKDPDTEPWDREYAPGWAVCLEPAFAFDTSSMYSSSGIQWEEPSANGFWINNALVMERELHSGDSGLRAVFASIRQKYEAHVIGDTSLIGSNEDQLTEGIGSEDEYAKGLWNVAQTDVVFDPASGFKLCTKWMSPGAKTVPDNLHAYKENGHLQGSGKKPEGYSCVYEDGGPFCMLESGKISTPRVIAGFYTHIQNAPFESVGQLGDVMVGPYETLATARAYRFGTDRADIHRVLDYFTTGEDRFPAAADYEADGTLKDDALDEELYSGVNTGRVNLNSPVLVHWVWPGTGKTPNRVAPAKSGGVEVRNPYPVAAALTGSSLWSDYHSATLTDDKRAMPASIAREIASAIVFDAGTDVDNRTSFPIQVPVTNGNGRTEMRWTYDANAKARVKNRLSDLGAAENGGVNPILKAVVENLATNNAYSALQTELVDADREAFVANSSSAFTTRGQTFLVIIRADAYTPRYGEETAEDGEGTTLATTHAVVELFRDPEFARYPDGSPIEDKDGNPVFFHNWYVKSFRIL